MVLVRVFLFFMGIHCGAQDFFSDADQFFKRVVEDGSVRYSEFSSNSPDLVGLITQIATANTEEWSREEQLAFYLNAYNIWVIHNIAKKYPVASPMDIHGFFDKLQSNVGMEMMTLNHLENQIIRPVFQDPRIHFALVCGAKDCPPIKPEAFFPEKVNQQLQERTVSALNDSGFIRNDEGVFLSEIFKWYAEDFGRNIDEVVRWINQYRQDPLSGEMRYYPYDWSLNDH